jgi:hypothetical protein
MTLYQFSETDLILAARGSGLRAGQVWSLAIANLHVQKIAQYADTCLRTLAIDPNARKAFIERHCSDLIGACGE